MNTPLRSLTSCLNRKLLTTYILTLSLVTPLPALAEFKPPSDQHPPNPNDIGSTTTRGGCSGNDETVLTALAPHSHIGKTVSSHPTFAWFVPDSQSFSMEFQLYEYDATGTPQLIGKSDNLISSPGIMTFSLPEHQPGLQIGRRYFWQVILKCNSYRPSANLFVRTPIERVSLPNSLDITLDRAGDRLERANLYAEAGLWYDALAEALEVSEHSDLREPQLNLLEDLAKLEDSVGRQLADSAAENSAEQRRGEELQQRSSQLMQIIEAAQQ